MAASGDNFLYFPGDRATVEVRADANGVVPGRGEMVELTGEAQQPQTPAVSVVSADGNGIGPLAEEPQDYDPDATYAANELVGLATLRLVNAVEWLETDDAYTPAVGDAVVVRLGGGIDVYAPGATPADTPDMIVGQVFTTNTGEGWPGTKAAVYRHR